MNIKATKIFADIDEGVKKEKRYIFLRGSSRSSKTISAVQYLIIEALSNPGISITIARATQVSIKNTILVDFKNIMEQMDIFHTGKFNKVDMTYTFTNGSIIRFVGLDDTTGRLRGLKSSIVMVDEVNTIDRDSWVQLDIRCEKYMIACYNPEVEEDSWIFDYEKRDNGILYKSSFLDNPFLTKEIIQSLNDLKDIDPDLYKIYALGELVPPREKIYIQPTLFTEEPQNIKATYIGIDYGYASDECGVVRVDVDGDGVLYATELLYEVGLTNQDLIFKLRELGIDRNYEIVSDSSEPKSIEEIRRAGFRIRGVKKGDGSVLYGIQKMRTFKIKINQNSKNLISEFQNYKFKKDRQGRLTNIPDGKDHLLDPLRYVVMEFVDKPKTKYSFL
jgi:phage terminase large subunit